MIGINRVKTWVLIAAMGGLFVLIGAALGGTNGAVVALGFALVFNFAMYWFSGSIAVRSTRSHPVTEQEYPALYRIVRELTQARQMPMPEHGRARASWPKRILRQAHRWRSFLERACARRWRKRSC